MKLPVVLRDEAEKEFDEAFDFYEAKQPGLGVRLAEKVQQVFDRISSMPLMHGNVIADVRKAVAAKFPYCVYYRAEDSQIQVIAVYHTSRDPADWQKRI